MKGFRTVIFNVAMATVSIGLAFDWSPFFDPLQLKWVLMAQAFGNVWIRAITTTPIGRAK